MRRLIGLALSAFILPAFAADAPAPTFTLATNAFLDAGILPVLYTCDGQDVSPELSWTNPPAKTQSFAVTMVDPDAPGGNFYHWVVYNIPSTAKELLQGPEKPPAGSVVSKNNWGKTAYNGPCPPKGSAHTYVITMYALDTKLKLPADATGPNVEAAMKGHVVGTTKLSTVYSRWGKA